MINFKFISKFNIIFDKLNYLFIQTLFCNTNNMKSYFDYATPEMDVIEIVFEAGFLVTGDIGDGEDGGEI